MTGKVLEHRRIEADPAAYILNLSYTGIGIARGLSRAGVRVVGFYSNSRAPGTRSKRVKTFYAPDSYAAPDALIGVLKKHRQKEHEPPILFPTRDHDIHFLDERRAELSDDFILALPTTDVLAEVMDKWSLYVLGKKNRILVPKTYLIDAEKECFEACEYIGFPALLKPVRSSDWRREGIREIVGNFKALPVNNRSELLNCYRRIASSCPVALAQEFIPGGDQSIVTYCSYVSRKGEILVEFNTRKILQRPAGVGTGIVVDLVRDHKVSSAGRRLVQLLKLRGISEVEFKYHADTNEPMLVEVNPRFWDQHTLAQGIGINLPLIAYLDMIGADPRVRPRTSDAPRKALRWVAEDAYLRLIAETILHEPNMAWPYLKAIRCKCIGGIWARDDIPPSIKALGNLVREMWADAINKAMRRV